jgi:hypothetical protein
LNDINLVLKSKRANIFNEKEEENINDELLINFISESLKFRALYIIFQSYNELNKNKNYKNKFDIW